jgi:apolipoprotein N-acyltransferase
VSDGARPDTGGDAEVATGAAIGVSRASGGPSEATDRARVQLLSRPRRRPDKLTSTPTGPLPATPRHRRGSIAVPSVVAGVGLALSLPPWGFWVLAFPAAGLLWWRLAGLGARTRVWAGWLAGLGCYVPGLEWARAFSTPGAVVLILVEALFVALGALVVPATGRGARALAFPAAMTLAEAARMSWPFGGLPIGGVFLGQAGGPVLNVARLGGPLALTLAVYVGGVGVGALVEWGLARWRGTRARRTSAGGSRRGPGGRPTGRPLAVGTLGVALVVAASLVGAVAPDGGPPVGHLTVAAVQGGGRRGFRDGHRVPPSVVLAAQFAATRLMQREDGGRAPELVLWPEDVVALDTLLADSPEQQVLADLARSLRTTLVVGVTETVSSTHFRNEVVAFGPSGRVVSHYEKVHRVPFGEYVPYRSFFAHFANLSAVPLNAVPGHGSGLLPTPAGPLATMISFEVFFADRGRSAVRAGGRLLIVPTNTSSYATGQVPTQEVAASEVQAVEQGRDLVQAAPTGYSAVVTNRGRLLARSVLGARQVVFADLALRRGWTLYVRFGSTPVLALAGAALVAGWLAGRRRARRVAPGGPAATLAAGTGGGDADDRSGGTR